MLPDLSAASIDYLCAEQACFRLVSPTTKTRVSLVKCEPPPRGSTWEGPGPDHAPFQSTRIERVALSWTAPADHSGTSPDVEPPQVLPRRLHRRLCCHKLLRPLQTVVVAQRGERRMTNGQCLPVDTSPCYRTLPIRLLPAKLSRMKLTKKKLPSIIPSDAGTGLVAHNLLLRSSTSPPAIMMQKWIPNHLFNSSYFLTAVLGDR